MRITFQSDGGFAYFPGLDRPVTVDTSELPGDQAARIEGLVRAAGFFERPAQSRAAAPGAADHRTYTISVDDGAQSHTVTTTDPVEDPGLSALIGHLQGLSAPRRG
jgi:hypothetical protein